MTNGIVLKNTIYIKWGDYYDSIHWRQSNQWL